MMDCCICKKPIEPVGDWDTGNDAWPVTDGRCCNLCDITVVTPARLEKRKAIVGPLYYVVCHEQTGEWQLCLRSGMPCMARRSLAAVLEVCKKTEQAGRGEAKLKWPLPVMHVIDDDIPGEWNGELLAGGRWIGRSDIRRYVYDIVMAGGEPGDAFKITADEIRKYKGL
jgi:hypothetical protein